MTRAWPSECWVDLFIRQSTLIDPQVLEGQLLPGQRPDEPMYDRMQDALQVARTAFEEGGWPTPGLARDLQRELTRGLPNLEERNASGRWRRVNVTVGGDATCPPGLIDSAMLRWSRDLAARTSDLRDLSEPQRRRAAHVMHDHFESVHPFLDGNGRTGRTLQLMTELRLDLTPTLTRHSRRWLYYEQIRAYRRSLSRFSTGDIDWQSGLVFRTPATLDLQGVPDRPDFQQLGLTVPELIAHGWWTPDENQLPTSQLDGLIQTARDFQLRDQPLPSGDALRAHIFQPEEAIPDA